MDRRRAKATLETLQGKVKAQAERAEVGGLVAYIVKPEAI